MNKGKRFTERMKFNGVKYEDRGDCNIICYPDSDENDPIDEMAIRLCELEDMLDDGELVSKDWHDEQVGHAELVIEEQKAEIEKLLCKNAELEVRCEGVLKDYYTQSKTCDEQRLEIERLKNALCDKIKRNEELIAAWQKQVTELKDERQTLVDKYNKSDEAVDYWCEKYKQAVKDTAKKVLDELSDKIVGYTENWVWEEILSMAKKYGVEVE